jgi:hypothetical protein
MEVVELVGAFARLQVYHSCRKENKAYSFTAALLLLYCCFTACRYTTHAAKRAGQRRKRKRGTSVSASARRRLQATRGAPAGGRLPL